MERVEALSERYKQGYRFDIEAIERNRPIDDARCFTGENDYPSLKTLGQFIFEAHPGWVFYVKDDIIRTYSKRV